MASLVNEILANPICVHFIAWKWISSWPWFLYNSVLAEVDYYPQAWLLSSLYIYIYIYRERERERERECWQVGISYIYPKEVD